jgi:hypothetical protein
VVEGFFDCLKVCQAGYGNVVALLRERLGAAVRVTGYLLSRVGGDAGRRLDGAAGQPKAGSTSVEERGAVAGGGAQRPTTRSTLN